jgi:hypothetical protein
MFSALSRRVGSFHATLEAMQVICHWRGTFQAHAARGALLFTSHNPRRVQFLFVLGHDSSPCSMNCRTMLDTVVVFASVFSWFARSTRSCIFMSNRIGILTDTLTL